MSSSAFPEVVSDTVVPAAGEARLDRAIAAARAWLGERQDPAGFWCGTLEGDTTCESYLILLETFLGRRGHGPECRVPDLARAIRARALPDGGWSQYPGGPADVSVSCLSYFALKIAGDAPEAPHLRRARAAIRLLGGAEAANSYTKYHLAFFGQYPWAAVPAVPPEMMFLPEGGPFTVDDMSSWSRTIFVPLSILYALRPVRRLPDSAGVPELFTGAHRPAPTRPWARAFQGIDRVLKGAERLPGAAIVRRRAVARAHAWMLDRLRGSDGLGAILPAMANAVLALDCLGYLPGHALMQEQLRHLEALFWRGPEGELRVQPCLSPVWDTVLAAYALAHARSADAPADDATLAQAATWLLSRQCDVPGDWARRNPVPPGGWYFEHRNPHYPDVDDTAMALMVLRRVRASVASGEQEAAMARGLRWMLGMQNRDGGWASFDRDNDKQWLTEVPFADHNAMIDPSTADLTGRVLECLGHFPGFDLRHQAVARARQFLIDDQLPEGCWYGRWGVNYLYGTAHALTGLASVGEDPQALHVRRAVGFFLAHQNPDGGWGESIASYDHPERKAVGASTASQTAWAIIGLLAAGEAASHPVRRGVRWLLDRQCDGTWTDDGAWTGTGFPRVFYLRYPYYPHIFPLLALAKYRAARGQTE